jgi:predicted metal-dependent phosphoesterase TrpH
VAKASASPFEVIAQVQALGAISVVAHPYVTGVVDLVPQLVEAGMGGIEAYHADHTAEQRRALAALATQLGVLCTGGSDFHGPDAPNPEIGSVELPEGCVTALLAASSR